MKIIQLNVGGFDNNFSYILIGENNEAVIIDPTGNKELIESTLIKNKLNLVSQLTTHAHPDHTELVTYFLKKGVKLKNFEDFKKEKKFNLAGINFEVIFTPGHTSDSACFLVEGNLFTGDTLFCKGVGTTAYGGNDEELENSLNFLETLNKEIKMWPGHDYGGKSSTLGEALRNSHKKPSEKVLKEIKKKVEKYEFDFKK